MKDVRDALLVAKASDGTLIRRPLSPHAGIYRWPVTMVASILNRDDGRGYFAIGTLLLVWWLVAAASGPAAVRAGAGIPDLAAGAADAVRLDSGDLFYHFWAGLRHLAWDAGRGLRAEKPQPGDLGGDGAEPCFPTAAIWAVAYAKLGG